MSSNRERKHSAFEPRRVQPAFRVFLKVRRVCWALEAALHRQKVAIGNSTCTANRHFHGGSLMAHLCDNNNVHS